MGAAIFSLIWGHWLLLLLYSRGPFDSTAAVAPLTLPEPYFHYYAMFSAFSPFWVGICNGSMHSGGDRKVKDVYTKGWGCRYAVVSCFLGWGLGFIGERVLWGEVGAEAPSQRENRESKLEPGSSDSQGKGVDIVQRSEPVHPPPEGWGRSLAM